MVSLKSIPFQSKSQNRAVISFVNGLLRTWCLCVHLLSFVCVCLCRRSVIVGAGYIAVEMAGILSTLGSKTSIIIRQGEVRNLFSMWITWFLSWSATESSLLGELSTWSFVQVLRNFDSFISANCTRELENAGIELWRNTQVGIFPRLVLLPRTLQGLTFMLCSMPSDG